jgi:hypothetical protein
LLLNEVQLGTEQAYLGVRDIVGGSFDDSDLADLIFDLPAYLSDSLDLNRVIQAMDLQLGIDILDAVIEVRFFACN